MATVLAADQLPRSRYLLPVLLACSSLTVMAGATIAPGLPGLVEHFSAYPDADYLSRFILTTPGLAIALSATLAGWVADKLGRRVLLQMGIVLYIVSGTAGLWLDDLVLLLISRFILGIAVSMIMVSSMALLTDHFLGAERDRAMGAQSSAMAIGAVVFISAGSILADMSWRAPFGVYLAPLILFPLVYWFVSKPPSVDSDILVNEGGFPIAHATLIYALGFFSMFMFYFLPTQLPFLALELGAQNMKVAGFAVVLSQVFAGLASAYYQRLKAHFSTTQVLLLSYGCLCAGYVVVSMANSMLVVYLCMPIIGLGLGFNLPNLTIWLMSKIPSTMRGRASGGMTSAIFIGQFLSPVLSQPIVNGYGLGSAFLVAGIMMLVLVILPAVVVLLLGRRV